MITIHPLYFHIKSSLSICFIIKKMFSFFLNSLQPDNFREKCLKIALAHRHTIKESSDLGM